MPQTAAITAPQTTTSDVDLAYVRLLLALKSNRARPLRALNSPAALRGRIHDIEAQIDAMRVYLKALVEDTAEHIALAKRPDDIVESALADMRGDVIGHLEQALERNQ